MYFRFARAVCPCQIPHTKIFYGLTAGQTKRQSQDNYKTFDVPRFQGVEITMTLNDYVETLKNALELNESKAKIVVMLFKAAGTVKEVYEDAASKWLSNKRKPKVGNYFPDREIVNNIGLINFFRNRSQQKIESLRDLTVITSQQQSKQNE